MLDRTPASYLIIFLSVSKTSVHTFGEIETTAKKTIMSRTLLQDVTNFCCFCLYLKSLLFSALIMSEERSQSNMNPLIHVCLFFCL